MDSSRFMGRLICSLCSVSVGLDTDVGSEFEAKVLDRSAILKLARSASSLMSPAEVSALALSRGISRTGSRTVLPCIPVREFARRGLASCLAFLSLPPPPPPPPPGGLRFMKESLASLFQAENTSFVASPEKPSAASHSLKIGFHLLNACTVELPILLSKFAILKSRKQKHFATILAIHYSNA